MEFTYNKRILVTGACGTVGSELVRLLLEDPKYQPAEVLGLDNNESKLFFLDQTYVEEPRAHFFLADVRDYDELAPKMQGIDLVFHAAALKHVVLCERSPFEAVRSNIHGVQNIIRAASENQVEKVISMSSDKAVNPTNVMGTSKLMGERLVTAANSSQRNGHPIFASTRFGNVLGSNGSVIPIFQQQIAQGGPVTLTDPAMTRFVMSIEEAVRLVIDSADLAQGGEVFITKMPVIRIKDLAEVMIRELAPAYGYDPKDIAIRQIGTKPGEKIYEELMSQEETRRAVELSRYFSILPAFRGLYKNIAYEYPKTISTEITKAYVSSHEEALSQEGLTVFLKDNHLLSPQSGIPGHPASRYWPGDKKGG
ncbi:polysaccharide biosynthesis protein [Nitrosococcus wardiae]|uniref:NAD-dependent epimerase/dehydratase family protein n=1 Tax=Nitrosococcus wardiae TaxID=1814290 RepID=A0A4P7C560_9GAMM|nr:polysaccharide biosynthesis protein [Nitrosococcus wardiae]QBQ55972.1 NAD-dependent epimerase/dehydratase family protein [Nitrosococcus wardiae]